jgi:chitinase
VPNSEKVDEIETYPLFLEAVRKEIGDKILSIAVPGRKQDFIAFTKEQSPKIFESVDMINVMSYDLINRRDNVTGHHSGVQGSLNTVNEYLALGAKPEQLNLGFAYYAKWFTTDPDSDCDENPIGCKLAILEKADGSDNGKSGALTFEASTVADPPKNLKESTSGQCGFGAAAKCPSGQCCSASGYWYVYPSSTVNWNSN